ncbi:MAG: mandelate racemase/muconate lactonizing enzyme family protein [Phycisphaeraceae bacterium]|nr:mandelate racemase/muconate lactonizing enzyme family protein [Phycisphaeraceae bacterium]
MDMNRRQVFGSLAAAGALGAWAGLGLLGPTAVAQDAGRRPRQAGEDEIRITDVRYYAAGPGYVKISTNEDEVFGFGEFTTLPDHGIAKRFTEWFKGLLVGVNPTAAEHIWQMLYRAHRNMRGGMTHMSVIGAIDMALWDIKGRLLDVPVYTLLGGPCRDRIAYYPNERGHKVTTHRLHAMVERPARIDPIVEAVRRARENVGRDGYVMLDGHGKFTAQVAIQLCRRIEDQDILYFEEVVPPDRIEDLARVKEATTVPLAKGERLAGIWAFRRPLEGRWVDVVNPDIVRMGGISQMMKLAAICEMYSVPLAPHSTHSALGLSATLHVAAAINNFIITEAYQHIVERNPFARGLSFPQRGPNMGLPPGPGLGVTMDEEALEKSDRDWKPGTLNRAYFTEDGAVADR